MHWRLALFSAIRVNDPTRLLLDLARLAAQFILPLASAIAQDLHQVSSVRAVRQDAPLGGPPVSHRLTGCFDDDAASAVSANNLAAHPLARGTATRPGFDRTILTLSMRMRSFRCSSVARSLTPNSLIRPVRASFKQHGRLPFRGDGGCIRIAAHDSSVESCK